jgi:tetratricopeptide (TPR) repeat protein/transglutaminase-like putative cysteine protease
MRKWVLYTAAAAVLPASPAFATDHLLFGAPEAWVVPVASPTPPEADDNSAFTTLLDNEQAMLGKGRRKFFFESIYRINSPQGLDDGNIKITWDPTTDAVTVHKLLIRRGGQVIDVLKSGQTFTTIRRETNLEAGMLDGELTATLLPEGLQVGDIVELSETYDHADPVTKDSAEVQLATFNDNPIGRGFAKLNWPSSLPVTFSAEGGLATPKVTTKDGISSIQYDMKDIEPLVLPSSAPGRFRDVRALNASTFANWGEIASLMKPYYDSAAALPATGPLRDEVEKIKRLGGTNKQRVEAALKLVQNNVRYVALNMGTGGYVPANAETTWSRRFGDCKAKTALLLGILHELHVEAEPVLAHTDGNDGLDRRQPQLGWFNHVLVRAHLDGKAYWLDGTRNGDTSIDRLETPAFDWGLPVTTKAALVRMVPDPLREPNSETLLDIDAHDGIHLPAPITITYVFRGDTGRQVNIRYNEQAPSQRDRYLRDFFKKNTDDWKSSFVSIEPQTVKAAYDANTGETRFTMTGKAKLDWTESNFYVHFSTLAYKPAFERTEGVNRDAPIAMDYPGYYKWTETVHLPKAFIDAGIKAPDIDTIAVGVQYHRHASMSGDAFTVETSERSIVPEVPYAEAIASAPKLRELNSRSLSLYVPDSYRPSDKDMAAWLADKPASASEFIDRGNALLDLGRYDESITDFTAAIDADKTAALGYSDRAIAYINKDQKDKARADLDAAAALDPKEPVMLRGRGLLAEGDGKWLDAVNAYTASLVKDSSNNWARGHRAMALAQLSRDDEALTDAAAALEADPDWLLVRRARDYIFLKRHQCADVVKDAGIIGDKADGDTEYLVSAARFLVYCDKRTDGFALFDKAITAGPSGFIYVNRARSRLDSDHTGRLADIDAAIKLEPKEVRWLLVKADEMDRVGDEQAALAIYDEALKMDPANFNAGVQRAVLLHRLGRTDEASKLFASLHERAKSATDFNSLCWEKATAGILLESALGDCNQALKMSPDAPGYLDSLGMTLLRMGRFDDAITAYDKAIAGGTGAISLMGRSIAYAQKGDKAKADADRKAALADDPQIASRAKRFGLTF